MTKLEELMELNNSVDTIIASAMEDNKRVEAEITATEIVLWNKMWDDIEEWYNKGYVEAALGDDIDGCINVGMELSSPKYKRAIFTIRFYNSICVNYSFLGCTTYIYKKGYEDEKIKRKNTFYNEGFITLLLYWDKIKTNIEKELEKNIAENIKRKTKETENTINYNNSLLKTLKGEN